MVAYLKKLDRVLSYLGQRILTLEGMSSTIIIFVPVTNFWLEPVCEEILK
jgi:hypothetical protein